MSLLLSAISGQNSILIGRLKAGSLRWWGGQERRVLIMMGWSSRWCYNGQSDYYYYLMSRFWPLNCPTQEFAVWKWRGGCVKWWTLIAELLYLFSSMMRLRGWLITLVWYLHCENVVICEFTQRQATLVVAQPASLSQWLRTWWIPQLRRALQVSYCFRMFASLIMVRSLCRQPASSAPSISTRRTINGITPPPTLIHRLLLADCGDAPDREQPTPPANQNPKRIFRRQ